MEIPYLPRTISSYRTELIRTKRDFTNSYPDHYFLAGGSYQDDQDPGTLELTLESWVFPFNLPLPGEGVHIGRSQPCHVRIPAPYQTVSRLHAVIIVQYNTPDNRPKLYLEDDSQAGTFVNGKRLTEKTFIKKGDIIRLAQRVRLMLFDPDELHHRVDFEGLLK